MRCLRPSNWPWWKNRRPGARNVSTAAAWCRPRRERRRGPRLVVVLEEAGEPVLVVEPAREVLAHRARVALAQPVVEALVVRVVEPLLLQRPLEVPVDLGHEAEARDALPHAPDGLPARRVGRDGPRCARRRRAGRAWPCRSARRRTGRRSAASSAIIASCERRVAVVELQRVRPAREVRVAAVREHQVARGASDPRVVLRRLREVGLGAADVVVGVLAPPRGDRAPCGWGRSRASAAGRARASRARSRASAASPPRLGCTV